MKRALQWLILLPLAVIGVAFAVANRHSVDISFDPFARSPAGQIPNGVPLYLVIILAFAAGALLGSLFTWCGQGKHRRALREARDEMARVRNDVARMKT
jgi:uncharacterized integral membrane protein